MMTGYTHITFVLDNSGSMDHLRMDTIGGYNTFKRKQNEKPGKLSFSLYQFDKVSRGYHMPVYIAPVVAPSNPLFGVANGGFVGISTTGDAVAQPLPSVTVGTISVAGDQKDLLIGGQAAFGVAHVNADPTMIMMNAAVPSDVPSIGDVQVTATFEFVDFKTVPDLSTDNYVCNTNTPLIDTFAYAIDRTGLLLAALPEEQRPEKVIFVVLTDGEENASRRYSHAQLTAKIKHQTEAYKWDFLFLGANQDAIQVGAGYGISRGRAMNFAATSASMGSTYNAMSDTVSVMRASVSTKDVNFDESIRAAVMDGTYESK
jgi:hypothetical protein